MFEIAKTTYILIQSFVSQPLLIVEKWDDEEQWRVSEHHIDKGEKPYDVAVRIATELTTTRHKIKIVS